MARSTAKLSVVGARPPRLRPTPTPETMLHRLFVRERKLEAELAKVRGSIGVERARYAAKHRLGCFPNLDTLRRTLG